jgi:hypothetical protein
MTSKFVSVVSHQIANYGFTRFKTELLDPEYTYLAIADPNQDAYGKLLEATKEIKILFKGRKAINRTVDHGNDPRNTLYIFEVADEYVDQIKKIKEEHEAERKRLLPRFIELCKLKDNSGGGFFDMVHHKTKKWNDPYKFLPEKDEYNSLMDKGFNYYEDYRNKR